MKGIQAVGCFSSSKVSIFFKGLYTSGIAGGGGKARKIKRKKITWESIQALKSVRRKTNSTAAKLQN